MGKLSNEEIYQSLMESRKQDSKRYACLRIAAIYDLLKKRIKERKDYEDGKKTSARFHPITDAEIEEMKQSIKETAIHMVKVFGLTQKDIDHYNITAAGKLRVSIA